MLDLGHEQLLDHPRADRGVRRILTQVLELARVGLQIVELAPSSAVEHADAVAAVDQAMHARRHIGARARMLMIVLD